MPLYASLCPSGHRESFWSKIDERDKPRSCSCGQLTQRALEAPAIRPDIGGYVSPVTGQWVGSRSQRQEDLKRTGSIEWEPGLKEHCESVRTANIEAAHSRVDASIDRTVAEMHAANLL